MKKTVLLLVALTFTPATWPDAAHADKTPTPKQGGIIKAAYASDPHSLDIHKELSTTATDTARHIIESLFTYGDNYKPQPLLVKDYHAGSDKLTHTVKLRRDVLFHNKKELTSEDVAASFNRWIKIAPMRPEIALFIDSVTTPDKETVVFKLKEPYADFIHNMMFGVIPKEIAEKYRIKTIPDNEVIGTGPYKIKAREIDRFVELVRNENYCPPGALSGDGHDRESTFNAYADKLVFNIVPDPTIRLLGMETGQYHYMESANYNDYGRIRENPELNAISLKGAILYFLMNCKAGPTANLKIRQAMQAAVDSEPILKAAFTNPELYTVSGSWMAPKTRWYSEAGTELYNQKDAVKAKKLLKESGYDGSRITVLTLGEIDYLRNSVAVLQSQLNKVGLKVDLQFVDQGSLVPRMMNPEKWQIVYLIQPAMPVPTMMPWTKKTLSLGWWTSPKKEALAHQLRTQLDPEKRFAAWEEMQKLCYAEAARVKIGDASTLTVASAKLGGYERKAGIGTRFWNAWLK